MNRQSVRYRIQDAWGWCTGMIQRDDMGWEVGGVSGLGTHVHPWKIHVNVWQNQYSIVKQNKVKIKINAKKNSTKKKNIFWFKYDKRSEELCTLKMRKAFLKDIKEIPVNGKVSHDHGFRDLILTKYQ